MYSRSVNSGSNDLLINPENLRIDIDKMVTCRSFQNRSHPQNLTISPDTLKAIKEELILTKNSLIESQKKFLAKIEEFSSLRIEVERQSNKKNTTITSSLNQSTTNAPIQQPKISMNHFNDSKQVGGMKRTPITGHTLDIWVRSDPLFQQLPTEDEIVEICKAIEVDKMFIKTTKHRHWSDILKSVVDNTQKESRKSKTPIAYPPPKPPEPHDIDVYWKAREPPFQIEDIQMQNRSTLHLLLSAFVEAAPLPKSEEASDGDILPTHVLLPHLDFDDYLSHSFEERLEFELESAGLQKQPGATEADNVFASDIQRLKEEIDALQPAIDQMRDEILAQLPEYRKDKDRRMTEYQEYTELLKELNRRSHRR